MKTEELKEILNSLSEAINTNAIKSNSNLDGMIGWNKHLEDRMEDIEEKLNQLSEALSLVGNILSSEES